MNKRIFPANCCKLALGTVALVTASLAVAHASSWDKKTVVTFGQSVEVPGAVLGPGKYVMKLIDLSSQRRVVEFTNERESHVFATTIAVPVYRSRVTRRTALDFYEAPAGQPQALRTWFYPGETYGQEFIYPRGRIAQIAPVPRAARPAVAVNEPSGPAAAELNEPAAAPLPEPELSSTAPTQPEPAESALQAQNNLSAPDALTHHAPPPPGDLLPQSDRLPHTASKLPGIAMLGLVSLGAAAAARSRRRSLE